MTIAALAGSPVVESEAPSEPEYKPAVTVRRSLASKENLVSMIDGKPYKMLKRHLSTHGLTPAEYRARYGLEADYPMVAESYAEIRRGLAKKIGLGRKPGMKVAAKASRADALAKAPRATKAPASTEA